MTRYDLKDVKLPVLSGKPLRITTRLIEFKATGDLLGPKLIKDAGIHLLREICLDEAPTNFPKHPVAQVPEHGETELSKIPQSMPPQTGFCPHTSADFCNAYSIGEITPPMWLIASSPPSTNPPVHPPLRAVSNWTIQIS